MKRQGDRESPSRMKRARGRSPNRRSYRENSPEFRDSRHSRDGRRNINQSRHRSPVVSPRYSPPVEPSRSRRGGRDQDEYYTTLLVRNFSSQLARDDIEYSLYDEFRKFGDVTVKVERDYNGDRVAYATFRSADDARECKNAKGHLVMHDRRLSIEAMVETHGHRDELSPNYRSPHIREPIIHSPRGTSPIAVRSPRRRSPKQGVRGRLGNRDRLPYREKPMSKDRYSPSERYLPIRERSSSLERKEKYYKPRDSPRFVRNRSLSRSPYRSPTREQFKEPSITSRHSPSVSPNRRESANGDEDDQETSVSGGAQDPNFFPQPAFMDKPIPPEDDPYATRTLFIGNLEPDVTSSDIRRTFDIYGKIEDIDVKRAARGLGSYCFVRFENLDQAYKAKISFNGKPVLKNIVRIGYGKVMLSSKIWVGGLGKWTSIKDLEREFDRFGSIRRIDYRRGDKNAAILFETTDAAQAACTQMRGFLMPGAETRLRMDFLDPEPGMPGYDSYLEWGRHDGKGHDSGHAGDTRDRHKGDYPNKSRYRGRNFEGDRKYKSDRRNDRSISPRDYRSRDNKYGSSNKGRESDRNTKAAALPDTAMTEMQFKHFHAKSCYTLHDLCQCFDPPCWQGGFVLKKIAFPVLFFLLDGDMGVFNRTTADPNSPTGRQTMFHFTQRLKLSEDRVAEVSRRMKSVDTSQTCIIVAVPGVPENLNVSGTLSGPVPSDHKPLRGLVKYFKDKEAAGIISIPLITLETPKNSEKLQGKDKEVSGMLHAFPPGAFSTEQLLKIGPSLQPQFFADDYMVIVLIKGSRSQLV